tara:strand:+ start:165 stop:1244 length:1080 start_codon:yes stop_codon:yes gene_type:complete
MATVTKSIGTNSRDYSTISAWEADLSNSAVYNSGDEAVGECYNDSTFDEAFNIDDTGPAYGLSSITLKANSSDKHDGTSDSGVKITYTGSFSTFSPIFQVSYTQSSYGSDLVKIEDLEFADIAVSTDTDVVIFSLGIDSCIMSRCLVNNIHHNGAGNRSFYIFGIDSTNGAVVQNTMIFNCGKGATHSSQNGRCQALYSSANAEYNNLTIHNIFDNTVTANSYGIFNGVIKNSIITNCGENFKQQTGSSSDYNLSSDTTFFGGNSIAQIGTFRLYTSTTQGSEDLHLKNDSPALRAAQNLGTTNDVQKDIDGEDRDTSGSTAWDIGADQCASCTTTAKKFDGHLRMNLDGDLGSFNVMG